MEDIKETNNDIPGNDIYNLEPIVATSKHKYPYRSAAFYVAIGSFVLTALMILICALTGFLSNGLTNRSWERCIYIVLGIALLFFAYLLFFKAKNDSKIENAVIARTIMSWLLLRKQGCRGSIPPPLGERPAD